MGDTGLAFGVLGPLLMTADGVRVPLGPPKQRAVMAMLVINRDRPVSVDALIDAVWEQDPVPAARTSIQSHISNLRGILRSAGAEPNAVLASAPPGYQLCVDERDCDLGRFAAAKAAGVRAGAAGRFEDASSHLSRALAEWRGPVLDDLRDFTFAATFATAVIEEKLAAHTARAEAEIACGRAAAVIVELETLTAEHPYREPLWAQLMTAYYVSDRQSDALGAYRRLKTALSDGLGIDPGRTVNELHERILRQEPLRTRKDTLTTHKRRVYALDPETDQSPVAGLTLAWLRDGGGREYVLNGETTRIGRFHDNDIVLDDTDVSRHHAVIIDTGTGFVITDLRSTNGVEVQGNRIRSSAPLTHGDRVRICSHDFVFEVRPAL